MPTTNERLLLKYAIYYSIICLLDLSHSDTRLSMMLNGLEYHVYNRCELYGKLEQLFGYEPSINPPEQRIQSK